MNFCDVQSGKGKIKTYLDKLMENKKFRKRFAEQYAKLDALAAKEEGKEKRITKKFIDNLKKGVI